MQLAVNGLNVSEYIQQAGFSESYEKVYDTSNAFTAADGTEIKRCMGTRKKVSVSLDAVPRNVKNMLRSRSRYSSLSCTIGGELGNYTLENFNASVIVQCDEQGIDLWSVKFDLVALSLNGGSSGDSGIYSITCGGMTFSMADNTIVGDIRISHSTGGLPVSGICASQLVFSIDLSKFGGIPPYFDPNAACTIGGFSAPTYYVTGRSISDGVYTITCADRTIFLDLPFNYTTLKSFVTKDTKGTEVVSTGIVLSEIARQAGFESGGGALPLDKIPYADLATSCRSILDALSSVSCGVWYCSLSNSLQFIGFGGYTGQVKPFENKRTDIIKGVAKGPVSGVQMINSNTDNGEEEVFAVGSVGSLSCIKINSKYANEGLCHQIFDSVSGKKYTVFSVAHCFIDGFIPICSRFYEDPHNDNPDADYFMIGSVTMYLSYTGAYASIGADAFSECEWDFTGELTRGVNRRIEEGRKYHGVSLSQKDGLVCEGAAGKVTMADGKVTFYSNPSGSTSSGSGGSSS